MHFFYKIDEVQIELKISEQLLFEKVDVDFSKVIRYFEKFEQAVDEFIAFPMSKAESEWMMSAYCKLTEANQPLPKWLRCYFDFCFDLVLTGVPPLKALGLNNPRHRPKESRIAERNEKIYLEFSSLMLQGVNFYSASLELSEKYHKNESHIQKIYSAVKKSIDQNLHLQFFDILDF